ncbi:MAG: MurR/RpiR family transcriptional regulator, partial [Nocardioidaceae bacterium]
ASLAALRHTLDSPAMASAVRSLAAAEVLGVVGMRASAALATHVGFFAQRILPDVRVVTHEDDAADALVQMHEAGDAALLVLAMPRYPASTVRTLRRGRDLGLTTVLVVDSALVDFAPDAGHVLVAPVSTGMVFDSHAAPVVLTMALLDGIAGVHHRRTQTRLEAHEALVDSWVHEPGSESG